MREMRVRIPSVQPKKCLCRLKADRFTLNEQTTARYRVEVPFGKVSVAVETLHLLAPLKCGMHEDEAVSLNVTCTCILNSSTSTGVVKETQRWF